MAERKGPNRDDEDEGLRLSRDPDSDPDAPPSAEEEALSARLRDALEDPSIPYRDADFARSLKAAFAPSAIDAAAHRELVDDLPSDEEIRLAAELRDALASSGASPSADADFARSLRAAWEPAELDASAHRAIVERALGTSTDLGATPGATAPASNVVALHPRRAALGAAFTVLALAATIVLYVSSEVMPDVGLARARSTQPLFAEPFKAGETSARIDRIAIARASDYRDNRFAKWGVR